MKATFVIPFVVLYKGVIILLYVNEWKHVEHFPLPLIIKLVLIIGIIVKISFSVLYTAVFHAKPVT